MNDNLEAIDPDCKLGFIVRRKDLLLIRSFADQIESKKLKG